MERIQVLKENGSIDYKESIMKVLKETDATRPIQVAEYIFPSGHYLHDNDNKKAYVGEVMRKMLGEGLLVKQDYDYYINMFGNPEAQERPSYEGEDPDLKDFDDEDYETPQERLARERAEKDAEGAGFPDSKVENDIEIKYNSETGEIDFIDTIIAILAKNPGVTRVAMKDYLFGKQVGAIYNTDRDKFDAVLDILSEEGAEDQIVVQAEGLYFLYADGIRHDMEVTQKILSELNAEGVDEQQAAFLLGGVFMQMEKTQAEAQGKSFDISQSHSASAGIHSDVMVEEKEEVDNTVEDPFKNLSEEESEKLRAEINEKMAAETKAKQDQEYKKQVRMINNTGDLIGERALINGNVTGTILEMRPSGVTFIIIDSEDPDIEIGSIFPLEYASGTTFRIIPTED